MTYMHLIMVSLCRQKIIKNNNKNDHFYPGLNPKSFVYKAATVPLLHTEVFLEFNPFTFLIVKPNNV